MSPLPAACGRVPARTSPSPDGCLVEDLAEILRDGLSAYLSLGPAGAVLAVKSPEVYAFGGALGAQWVRMTPHERARLVLEWIRSAARYGRRPRIRYELQREPVA